MEEVQVPEILDKAKILQLLSEDYAKLSPSGTILKVDESWEQEFDFEKRVSC